MQPSRGVSASSPSRMLDTCSGVRATAVTVVAIVVVLVVVVVVVVVVGSSPLV